MTTIASLFKSPPEAWWGLRGDPFLWKDMARVFRQVPLPESDDLLMEMLAGAYLALTGHSIEDMDQFFVKRYAHGGMSSGHIDPEFWRTQAMPLLRERFVPTDDD